MERINGSNPVNRPSDNSNSLRASCREYLLDRNWRLFEAPISDGPEMASAMMEPTRIIRVATGDGLACASRSMCMVGTGARVWQPVAWAAQ